MRQLNMHEPQPRQLALLRAGCVAMLETLLVGMGWLHQLRTLH